MKKLNKKWYWNKWEETILLNLTGMNKDEDISLCLGRTVQAIRHKRCRLLKKDLYKCDGGPLLKSHETLFKKIGETYGAK